MEIKLDVKAAVVALVVLLLLPGVSQALTDEQKALGGLKGLYVSVDDIQPEVKRLGITKDQIKTDVELRLRKAGVKVLTEKECTATPGSPFLYVNVNTNIVPTSAIFSYAISVGLKEAVMLNRDMGVSATIWERTVVGNIEKSKISKIRETIGDGVDIFLNDYLAANQKQ